MTEAATTERKKPGRKPRPPLTETAEFKAAVAQVASDAVQAALSGLMPKAEAAGISLAGSQDWMQALAVTLAEIGNQGTGRKTVAPHILKQREDARGRMVDLILKARAEGQPATYRLTAQVHLAERVIDPFWTAADHTTKSTEIDWGGIPNDAMVPVNDTAKEIHAAFKDSVGTMERVVPEERLGITPNGLIVRNAAVTDTVRRRTGSEAPHTGDGTGEDVGLKIHHENQPGRYKDVHILGTIQEPARQSI